MAMHADGRQIQLGFDGSSGLDLSRSSRGFLFSGNDATLIARTDVHDDIIH